MDNKQAHQVLDSSSMKRNSLRLGMRSGDVGKLLSCLRPRFKLNSTARARTLSRHIATGATLDSTRKIYSTRPKPLLIHSSSIAISNSHIPNSIDHRRHHVRRSTSFRCRPETCLLCLRKRCMLSIAPSKLHMLTLSIKALQGHCPRCRRRNWTASLPPPEAQPPRHRPCPLRHPRRPR